MQYVQVNIGRNQRSTAKPMGLEAWFAFKLEARKLLAQFTADFEGTPSASQVIMTNRVEIHEGQGTWDASSETSAHVSVLVDTSARRFEGPEIAQLVTTLRRALRRLGEDFDQECIALIVGSQLVKVPTRREPLADEMLHI